MIIHIIHTGELYPPFSGDMLYGLHAKVKNLQVEVSGCSAQIQELSPKAREHDKELSALKKEMELPGKTCLKRYY